MGAIDIGYGGLAASYLLLVLPLAAILWLRIRMVSDVIVSVARMTVQLLLVGLYLQVVFDLNSPWVTLLWLLVMILVADISVLRGCRLRIGRFAVPLFLSLGIGTALPLFFFVGGLLGRPDLLDARYMIPIAGMILGNCLRADIIGIRTFYDAINKSRRGYLQTLAAGASQKEAIYPFLREACKSALAPTTATMATIGLVALPGMMTGVILGGTPPAVAIKYQIAIMLAIFCGTAVTVIAAILLTSRSAFNAYGVLDQEIFVPEASS
jgi:putative ABC transport system permease protein